MSGCEIVWNVIDQNGNELPVPHEDLGPPPAVGDMFNFWIDRLGAQSETVVRGRVLSVEHDIRQLETPYERRPVWYRYAVVQIDTGAVAEHIKRQA